MVDHFDQLERQEARLLDELLSHITNIKFVRTQIDLSLSEESKVRKNCVSYYTEILEDIANLCWLLDRKTEPYEYYLDKTRTKALLSLSELRSGTELYDLSVSSGSRLKSLLKRSDTLRYLDEISVRNIVHYLELIRLELYDSRKD